MKRWNPAEVSEPHQPSVEIAFAGAAVTRVGTKSKQTGGGNTHGACFEELAAGKSGVLKSHNFFLFMC